ncbi:hypothetical protein ACLESO_38985 [Pyxidicoccus sp. 3LG]
MRERLVVRLAAHGSALDYRQRLSLGLLLDIPADPSLAPATVARLQQAHAVAELQPPRRRPGPNGGAVFDGEAPASDRLLNRR